MFLKCSLGIINKPSHLVHETCLARLGDLIDEGTLGRGSLFRVTISPGGCWTAAMQMIVFYLLQLVLVAAAV